MSRSAAAPTPTPEPRNAFDLAQPIETVKAPDAKDRTVQRPTVGLRNYAALCEIRKTVDALIKTSAPAIHAQMLDYFVPEGCRISQTPANYEGVEGTDARASLQLKKKANNQPLTDEEVAMLKECDIPVKRHTLVPRMYVVNPDHMGNPKLVKTVGYLIGDMLGKTIPVPNGEPGETITIPDDLFSLQYEQATNIVDDESLDAIFKKHAKKPQAVRLLVAICGQLSISPEWTGDSDVAATLARDILFDENKRPDQEKAVTKASEMDKRAKERSESILGKKKRKK